MFFCGCDTRRNAPPPVCACDYENVHPDVIHIAACFANARLRSREFYELLAAVLDA